MWWTICAALPSSRLEWPNGIRAPRGQPLEPGIAIDPQDALKAAEMRRRSLGLTIRAVEVYSRRRLWTDIDPAGGGEQAIRVDFTPAWPGLASDLCD